MYDRERKRRRETDPKSSSSDAKKSRQELDAIKEKMTSSEHSIGLLKAHLEKGTCPKTLRYKARANITPDDDFKNDIGSIRKKAEQALVGAGVVNPRVWIRVRVRVGLRVGHRVKVRVGLRVGLRVKVRVGLRVGPRVKVRVESNIGKKERKKESNIIRKKQESNIIILWKRNGS